MPMHESPNLPVPHYSRPAKRPFLIAVLLVITSAVFPFDQTDPARGINLYNQGRFAEAKSILENVVAEGKARVIDMAILGMTYTRLGEYDQAQEILDLAKERDPFDPLVHIGLGTLAFNQQIYDEAFKSFDMAHRIKPGLQQAVNGMVASLVNRSIVLYGEGDTEQARRLLVEALKIDPGAVAVLQNLSLMELETGEFEKSAEYLEEALEIQPDNPRLLELLIRVRKEQGWSHELVGLYDRLIEIQPENAETYAALGMLLNEQGQTSAAEDAFIKAEFLATDEPYPYLYLARLSRSRGESQATILSRLHSAIGCAVRKSGMIQMTAASAIQQKQGQLSSEDIEDLQRLSSLSEEPRRILIEALQLLSETHTDASTYEADLLRLSSWYPHSQELRIAMGHLFERENRYGDAYDHWMECIAAFPTAVEAHLGLARAMMHLGELENARIAYLRVRDLNPENREIYTALLDVYASLDREQELMTLFEELYTRERTNTSLLYSWADLEDRLGIPDMAEKHRLRAKELEERR